MYKKMQYYFRNNDQLTYLSDKSAIRFNFYPTGYHFVGLQFWIYSGL